MSDQQKISGIKSYLRRTKTTAQLEAMATDAFASASEEITITSHNMASSGAAGVVNVPKWLLLQILEELITEGGTGRQMCAVVDRSRYSSPV